jgi:hypothetical protein
MCDVLHGGQEKQYGHHAYADGQGGDTVQQTVGKIAGFCGVGVGIASQGTGRIITVGSDSFHGTFLLGFIFVLIIERKTYNKTD